MKFTSAFLNTHHITADTPTHVRVKSQDRSIEHCIREDGTGESAFAAKTTENTSDCVRTASCATNAPLPPPTTVRPRDQQRDAKPTDATGDQEVRRKADVYLKCKNWPRQLVLPDNSNSTYYATEPLSALFGSCNEHEFSSNIWFLDPVLKNSACLEDGQNAMKHITRHYYEDECTIFYDSKTMSTRYFDNCHEFTTKLIVRVDCETGNDVLHKSINTTDNVSVSVKLRVCRHKYNWSDKTTLVLSRSIELPMQGWESVRIKPPTDSCLPLVKATKSRQITFWVVKLTHCNASYHFRVAFRRRVGAKRHTQCNIECEETINGELFGNMFYALYRYYLFQYETQDRSIDPVIRNHSMFQQSHHYTHGLDENQRRIIDTIRLVALPYGDNTDEQTVKVAPSVAEFIVYLGIHTYVCYSESTDTAKNGIEYDQQFQHIKIHESRATENDYDHTICWVPSEEVFFE